MKGQITPIRAAAGVLSALTLASVIWGLVLVFAGPTPNWGAFGFEIVIAAAAVFAALYALAILPQHASGLTLASIAGAILISAGLALVALAFPPSDVLTHPLFLARFLLVSAYTLLAVLVTLASDSLAWKSLGKGILLSAISPALIAGGFLTRSSWLSISANRIVQMAILVLSLMALTALAAAFCVGLHLIIRAFERATEPPPPAR